MDVIKKKYPIIDENGQSATYPTFASQVFFDDGTCIADRAFNNLMARVSFVAPASGWIQTDTGRYTQTVAVEGITSHSQCYHLDLDMSTVNEDTIEDIKEAWSLVDNAETTDEGILLTCFTDVPTVDLPLIVDIQKVVSNLPNANGVNF